MVIGSILLLAYRQYKRCPASPYSPTDAIWRGALVRIVPFHRPQEYRAGVGPGQTQLAYVGGGNVPYGSQRECLIHHHRAIDKAQKRLRGLSKYTRKPTRTRLVDRLIEREVFIEDKIDKLAQMLIKADVLGPYSNGSRLLSSG